MQKTSVIELSFEVSGVGQNECFVIQITLIDSQKKLNILNYYVLQPKLFCAFNLFNRTINRIHCTGNCLVQC